MEVAEFYYDVNSRQDGLGVLGEHGGKNTNQRLYKLKEIRIYSLTRKALKGQNADPIRVIKFDQDELCPGIKNSSIAGQGKLTLTKVAFRSGKSNRELQSPFASFHMVIDLIILHR